MLLVLDVVLVLSMLLYSGGLLALGAIVAPVVFRSGLSGAADVMTSIFTRFDRLAVALCVVALLAEAISLAIGGTPLARARIVRGVLVVLFALGVGAQSGVLSPTIARMHAEGVQRHVGPRGQAFDRVHNWSSRVGKITVSLAIAAATMVLAERGARLSRDRDRSIDAVKTLQ
jgi:hypothetical protein